MNEDTMKDCAGYEESADTYRRHVEREDSWNNLYERPYLCSKLGNLEGKQVLDLGTATGFYAFHAAEQGARVTAVDISRSMIESIREKDSQNRINTVCADVSAGLPFIADDSQDVIIVSLMIHYLEDWDAFLAECHRVLKRGGELFISTHHPLIEFRNHPEVDYFGTVEVQETWGSDNDPFDVSFFVRPLSERMRPFLDSPLTLLSIDEPLPGERCRNIRPDLYERLKRKPAFLFFHVRKEH